MSVQRKQIILNEIAFWKKNKLLPEHYCDFLIALYARGEEVEDERKEKSSQALLAKKKVNKTFLYVTLGFLTALLIVSLIIITTAAFIPIIAAGMAICLFLYIAIKLAKTKSMMMPLLFVFSALLLLGVSFKVWDVYFVDYPLVLIGLMIGNCLLWLFSGLLMKLVYFSISGIIGTALILFYLFKFYL
ncbi:hypothetical protein [Psychrobacillus lasiicapitis]|uniref:Uncharacterized protein n=1 Tax=Psychrobacillus lasiicapitis TaxID=1636719 RepID=A0A544TA26_9BACI|nr:hypothetical protein [Psychrobacillus lasiicapitis]TQR14312.1 hypothetical protein FG382_07595 [Psychrobacillus lasiicapitis]GGA32378.1 hypothetical protein GCM10011384_22490 [Psychrobacillus lasiicapitis]